MTESRIVSATGIASNSIVPGHKSLARAIEAAMSAAVYKAAEMGITEPDKIRAMMMEAREKTKAEFVPAADDTKGGAG